MKNTIQITTPHKSRDLWATSPGCFADAKHLYGRPFAHDVAAERHTTKCSSYWTAEDDALGRLWPNDYWCNPPFSLKVEFITAARLAQQHGRSGMMLLPYEPLTKWWRDNLSHDVVIYEPDGRYNFLDAAGVEQKGVNFGSAFVLFPAHKLGPSVRVPFVRGCGA